MRLLRTAFAVSLLCSVSPGANALSYRLGLPGRRTLRLRPLLPSRRHRYRGDRTGRVRDLSGIRGFAAFRNADAAGLHHPLGGRECRRSLSLGLAIRALGLNATVGGLREGGIGRGFCGSACVFVLMGGRTRNVAPGSIVAVHSPKRVVAPRSPGGGLDRARTGLQEQGGFGPDGLCPGHGRGPGIGPAQHDGAAHRAARANGRRDQAFSTRGDPLPILRGGAQALLDTRGIRCLSDANRHSWAMSFARA